MKRASAPSVEIVIPVYNEAATLARHVDRLMHFLQKELDRPYQVTIVNNGSTDKTLQVARSLRKKHGGVTVLALRQKGRGRALRAAWKKSTFDVVAYMDADLATDLDCLKKLLAPLDGGKELVVVGSRLQKGSQVKRSFIRTAMSHTYAWFAKTFLKVPTRDFQCGFKAMSRTVASRLLPKVADNNWFFDTELIVRAHENNIEVVEIPIKWQDTSQTSVIFSTTIMQFVAGVNRLCRERRFFITPERIALAALLVFAAWLYFPPLQSNTWLNPYYSAATQAASTSWEAFLFGSFDSGNFITIDKIPLAVWIPALFARVLGFNQFSLLLPHMLAGLATIYLLYVVVRRDFGIVSAFITALVFVFTPVAATVFRFNNPDSFLTLLLVASTYCFLQLMRKQTATWYVATGLLLGLAFQAKALQALIVVPVFAGLYIWGHWDSWYKNSKALLAGSGAFLITALWWPVMMWLIPSASRPYIGSTKANSIWELLLGYNGFARLTGTEGNATGAQVGSAFGGEPGVLRMFNTAFGATIGWLLPLALLSGILGIWLYRTRKRQDMRRLQALLWTGWLVVHTGIFSATEGAIHPYYVAVLAPPVAALIGIAFSCMRDGQTSQKRTTTIRVLLGAGLLLSTAVLAPRIVNQYPGWHIWLTTFLPWLPLLLAAMILYTPLKRKPQSQMLFLLGLLGCALVAPAAATIATRQTPYTGYIPTAQPEATDRGRIAQIATVPPEARSYLLEKMEGKWVAATPSSLDGSLLQLATGKPVMAIGGFSGKDDPLSVSAFQAYVTAKEVRFFATTRQPSRRCDNTLFILIQNPFCQQSSRLSKNTPGKSTEAIQSWITQNSTLCLTSGNWRIYDLSGKECG